MEPQNTKDEEWVVSEVHMTLLEVPPVAPETEEGGQPLYISRFPFYGLGRSDDGEEEGLACPPAPPCFVDEEGDLVVPRRRRSTSERKREVVGAVTLLHALQSSLPSVGLQVHLRRWVGHRVQ